jgi:hypothetical protein
MECAPAAASVPSEPFVALPATAGMPGVATSQRLSARPLPSAPRSAAPIGVEFRPFAGRPASPIPAGDVGLSIDASYALDRGARVRAVGRVYVWGPSAGDGDTSGHWQVLWSWPWQSGPGATLDTRSSAPGSAPWPSLEAAARTLGNGLGLPPEWTLVPSDDPDHALLLERRPSLGAAAGGLLMLAALDADRAPVEVRSSSGEPWPDLQGAVRVGGRWYVATSQGPSEPAATVVWTLDGATAREVARVPRVAPELSGPARLARRIGGAAAGDAVGLVVVGPDADGAERGSSIWVSSLDPEAHAFGEPELLGPSDLSDRTLAPCTGDDSGWEVDAAFPGTIELRAGEGWRSPLHGGFARLRIWRKGACIDDVFGSVEAGEQRERDERGGSRAADGLMTPAGSAAVGAAPWGNGVRTVSTTVLADRVRARLRCHVVTP